MDRSWLWLGLGRWAQNPTCTLANRPRNLQHLDEAGVVGLGVPVHDPQHAHVCVLRAPHVLHKVGVFFGRDAAVSGDDGRDVQRVAHVDELERPPAGDEVMVPSACVASA